MGDRATGHRKIRWGRALFWASVSAWVVYIIYALLGAIFETYFETGGRTGMVGFVFALAVLGFPIALAICLLIGGPALLAAEFLKLTKWWQAALTGALGGALVMVLLSAMFGRPISFGVDIQTAIGLAVFSTAGACAGITAWGSLWLDGKYRRAMTEPR